MGTVFIPASTSSVVCFSFPTCKRHPSQEEVQLVSLLFTPQRQLTYRSRNSVEFHAKDLEWLSRDLRSLDRFNWSGYQATEVNKESVDNNRVSNTLYLPMIQASPTEWSILNTVLLSFLSDQEANQLYHTGIASSCNFKTRRFHQLKSYMGSVCYLMRDSWLKEIVKLIIIYPAEATVQYILKGSNYYYAGSC